MKKASSIRLLAATLLIGTLAFIPCAAKLLAQTPDSATQTLLDRAHTLELRGRIDIAAQDWQQVLLIDPNNIDALAGLARSAKLSGNPALANVYLARIKAINPHAAEPTHPLLRQPRPTIISPSSLAHRVPEAQHPARTPGNSNTAPTQAGELSSIQPTAPTQQAKSQSIPQATQPQPDVYGPYVPYVPASPKVTPPQTEVAVAPPLACPIAKPKAPRVVSQRQNPIARPQIPQPTTLSYGQQYPQPRPTRSKPVQPPTPPAIVPPCEPSAPSFSTPTSPVS